MKNKPSNVPDIIKNINPVTEQSGPVSHDAERMQIPDTVNEIPGFISRLLTPAGPRITDKTKD